MQCSLKNDFYLILGLGPHARVFSAFNIPHSNLHSLLVDCKVEPYFTVLFL